MKTSILFIASIMLLGCANNQGKSETENVEDSTEVVAEDSVKTTGEISKWVITITATTTIQHEITKEEAEEIDKEGNDDYYSIEIDGVYYASTHKDVEIGTSTITEPKYVNMLNGMMDDPDYEYYMNDVAVEGNEAHAIWYGGNRGGGIEEDFPEELKDAIMTSVVPR